MTTGPKFTREDLDHWKTKGYMGIERGLAAFALTLLDRAEKAERERDEARALKVPTTNEAVLLAEMAALTAKAELAAVLEELDEAEEAILDIRSRVLAVKTGEPREELWNLLKYAERWQSCDPAVRRALERKGEG